MKGRPSAGLRIAAFFAAAAAVVWAAGARDLPARAGDSLIIRVGILADRPEVRLDADGPVTVEDVSLSMYATPSPAVLPGPAGGAGWTAKPSATGGLDVAGVPLGPAVRLTAQQGLLRVDGRPYRGVFELRRTPGGGITVVNVIDLEAYLDGVIKGEMDPRWPPEAVRAQAIAARTLAVQRIAAHPSAAGFDLPATTDAQVYLGAGAEDPAANAAVASTRGLIVTYEGRPIFAAYHSNSGGHTEDSENVWGTLYPYLRGVPDPYALEASGVAWQAALPLAAVEADLAKGGVGAGPLADVSPGRVTPWGRAVTVVVHSEDGRTRELNANRFRLLVGADVVRSTMFTVARRGAALEFSGRGSGHGVGLDQWGARAMAVHGFGFEQILKYYYTGVAIEPRY
jgi:stage II sporulation protein D